MTFNSICNIWQWQSVADECSFCGDGFHRGLIMIYVGRFNMNLARHKEENFTGTNMRFIIRYYIYSTVILRLQ